MRYTFFLTVLVLARFVGATVPSDEENFLADGVVVAVQKAKDEARINDPNSMGDMVEVWMLRIDRWSKPEKPRLILVQYTHHDPIVKDGQLDNTVWRFELRKTRPEENGTCMNWWSQSFVPTALAANRKLPSPNKLPCFLMQKRPVALHSAKASQQKSTTPTTQ